MYAAREPVVVLSTKTNDTRVIGSFGAIMSARPITPQTSDDSNTVFPKNTVNKHTDVSINNTCADTRWRGHAARLAFATGTQLTECIDEPNEIINDHFRRLHVRGWRNAANIWKDTTGGTKPIQFADRVHLQKVMTVVISIEKFINF